VKAAPLSLAATDERVIAAMGGHLPEAPRAAPDLSPHTWRAARATRWVAEEPAARVCKEILFAVADPAVPPPPTAEAIAADLARAREIQAAPAAQVERTARWWSAGSAYRWNEIARTLTAREHLNSGHSSRLFAMLAVAQHDAAMQARRLALRHQANHTDAALVAQRGAGHVESYSYPSVEAAIAQASVTVLSAVEPGWRTFLEQNAKAQLRGRVWMGANRPSDIEAGAALGALAAQAVLERAKSDGAERADGPRVKETAGQWYSAHQTLPGWGNVKPWMMERGDQFRAPPPPAVDSAEMRTAVQEIRGYADTLTAEQLAIADYWNLGVGAISVPGVWNQIALDHARADDLTELETVRLLAFLNMAIMDAGIASWDTKYHYRVPRPSMVDRELHEYIKLPTHPSYTSGHSAFSGAAEGVLAEFFPASKDEFHRLAEEASASRWYGGIHFRFDGEAGLTQGRQVADWVIEKRAAVDGCAARS
jgi:membrane-associated phospholipid phosphatase